MYKQAKGPIPLVFFPSIFMGAHEFEAFHMYHMHVELLPDEDGSNCFLLYFYIDPVLWRIYTTRIFFSLLIN